ncbi:MAG: NAD(+) diphosphatase [Microbacterium sp.]
MFCTAPVGIVDRAAGERESEALLERVLDDPRTRALLVHGDAAPRSGDGLGWLAPAVIRDELGDEVEWAFLGRDGAAAPVVAATTGRRDEPWPRLPDGWLSLREAGATLPAPDAELLTVAVSISRFLGERFCSRCGSEAHLAMAGWSRRCTGCGAELFPRTDPAIIVATESVDGSRLLLGANAAWQGRMYSCFAGFVEAGESLETAVHREIEEEAGVRLSEVRYAASQPWPYPRSLMLGFRARARVDEEARPDGTEIIDVRWFTREEIREGLTGNADFGLPGSVSIAHRLIRDWAEETAADAGGRG